MKCPKVTMKVQQIVNKLRNKYAKEQDKQCNHSFSEYSFHHLKSGIVITENFFLTICF